MKTNFIMLIALLLVSTTGCETSDSMKNDADQVVLSYPAVNQYNIASSGLNFWKDALINPDMGLESETLTFSLNIPRGLDQNIKVEVGIDESKVEEANATYSDVEGNPYMLMPSEYYNLSDTEISFEAGEVNQTFEVEIKPAEMDISETGYLLPVTIKAGEGIEVSFMNTAYIHIEKDPNPPFSRSKWSVVDFSSQEAEGEGPDNGRVEHLFDNNTGSFWHSQWQDDQPGPPHWFVVDMGEMKILNGVMILPRQGVGSEGRPQDIVLEGSVDGEEWTVIQNISLPDEGSWHRIEFDEPADSVQFFKMTINTMYGDVYYTNMAEFQLF